MLRRDPERNYLRWDLDVDGQEVYTVRSIQEPKEMQFLIGTVDPHLAKKCLEGAGDSVPILTRDPYLFPTQSIAVNGFPEG